MHRQPNPFGLSLAAIAIAAISLLWSTRSEVRVPSEDIAASTGLIQNLDSNQILRAGYGVFPPFSFEDPKTGKVSGVAVDIISEIARQAGVRVEWKRFNWNTMAADLKRGEYDLLADAIFQTPARGREFAFTEPYAYFAIGIGVVKTSESRFAKFNDINSPQTRVAVGQGFAEETFVKARAPDADVISIPSSSDTAAPINAVLTGRADIAIVNLEDAKRFVKANSKDLKILWDGDPPAFVPAGFALRLDDQTGVGFLNVSLRNLRATGVLKVIATRYDAQANFEYPR